MNLGENIINAFSVVCDCHLATNKLMNHLKNDFDADKYVFILRRYFLRYSSTADPYGWCFRSFILPFQRLADGKISSNGCIADAPIYVVDIKFTGYTTPKVLVSRMHYEGVGGWGEIAANDHWGFYQPNAFWCNDFDREYIKEGLFKVKPKTEAIGKKYWNFTGALTKELELVDINGDNCKEMIFGAMEELSCYPFVNE